MLDGLQIGTLRAPATAGDLAARLRIERALGAADLCPPGLPAGAVLIVRRLATLPPGAGSQWERAARKQLADLWRRAARPARGDRADQAEAVLFADQAELLACLADDVVAGAAATRWWWRSYLRGRPASVAQLPSLLAAEPAALPAALAMLDRRGRSVAVLAAVPPGDARALAERLAATFGAGPLPLDTPPEPAGEPRQRDAVPVSEQAPANLPPPWPAPPSGLAREQQLLLGLALALAERPIAPRAPAFRRALAAWWRAAGPDSAVEQSVASIASPRQGPAAQVRPEPAGRTAPGDEVRSGMLSPGSFRHSVVEAPVATTGGPLHAPATTPPATPKPGPAAPPAPLAPAPAPNPEVAGGAKPAASPPPASRAEPPSAPASTARPGLIPTAPVAPFGQPPTAPPEPSAAELAEAQRQGPELEGGISTELGGALFLINLLIYLGLPECFDAGWRLSERVGSWRLLELFARGLLADPAAHAGDPIWAALAALDGRHSGTPRPVSARHRPSGYRSRPYRGEREPDSVSMRYLPLPLFPLREKGAGGMRASRDLASAPASAPIHTTLRPFRIPAAWLQDLPPDPAEQFVWAAAGRHLRIWSSRGYLLFDGLVRRPGRATARAILAGLGLSDTALARVRRRRSILSAIGYRLSAIESRWLALVLPYVRLRLALALGLDPAADLGAALLLRPGRLFVSATHVDLVMGLGAISLPVRLAGLDRNPGWMAEYGRVILFHFAAPGEQEAAL